MKITFVCLGNICRSPMAQYLALDYVQKNNLKNIEIDSCGTANYHEGEFMHNGTSKVLNNLNIEHSKFKSKPINKKIFDETDYLFVMDDSNYENVVNKFGHNKKIQKITNFCTLNYNYVPDPWYSHNFAQTYEILYNSITNFFKSIGL